ncbi:unnamed protein product [Haemonchus placei]|uniref:Uncharacterized protein n=1 Tax=Haemonchus placei TaxID=6290 RepID=A0A0N4WLQ6_HAEPC|nr:unnamed protein product [Haemonchus placei]
MVSTKSSEYISDRTSLSSQFRFHHFHPTEQLLMYKDPFARGLAYYPPLQGAENFSPEMIGFHHLSPHEMRILDYVLYKLKRRTASISPEHLDDQGL